MSGTHSTLTLILAGTCFFLYGMSLASENLQKLSSNKIRDIIAKLSDRPVLGVFAGVVITVLVQSSGAVTSMLVGLGTAGVITLKQVMGIILGTSIGTTITVQILSFNIAQFGLPIFSLCFVVYFLTHRTTLSRVMATGMGFGLMFWGLQMIGLGTMGLKDMEIFVDSLDYLNQNPFIVILITAAFTALVHSSAVTIGFAMSLAASGLLTLPEAFIWVYGANIGTTATALMASTGGNYVGRQVAWAHCFHKVIMVSLFYYLTPYVAGFIETGVPQRDVANAHLLFNCLGAILFFPFIKQGSNLVERLIQPGAHEKEFSVKFLDRVNFESPSVVIAHTEREIMRMGDIVYSMLKDSLDLMKNEDHDLRKSLKERDNKVDLLNREISLFISKSLDNNDSGVHKQMVRLFSFANDLESAADVVDNNILELAEKKHALKLEFSDEGWRELEKMHVAVLQIAEMTLSCFQTQSKDLAAQVVYQKREMRKLEKELREAHLERLIQGRRETMNTSSIHMDLLGEYRRIVGLLSNHVYGFLREQDKYNLLPRG